MTRGPKSSNGDRESIFNFSYQNRDNEGVLYDLGRSILKVAECTPGGMLIFFQSYRVMERCYEIWDGQKLNQEIEKKASKKVFMEPKDPAKYQATMEKYYFTIFGNPKG